MVFELLAGDGTLLPILELLVARWVLCEKAGVAGWASLIPIYSSVEWSEIAGRPAWWGLVVLDLVRQCRDRTGRRPLGGGTARTRLVLWTRSRPLAAPNCPVCAVLRGRLRSASIEDIVDRALTGDFGIIWC